MLSLATFAKYASLMKTKMSFMKMVNKIESTIEP